MARLEPSLRVVGFLRPSSFLEFSVDIFREDIWVGKSIQQATDQEFADVNRNVPEKKSEKMYNHQHNVESR